MKNERKLDGVLLSFWLLVAGMFLAFPVYASKRVALVIGNDHYQNVSGLKKAVNDASTISGVLKQIGFEVLQVNDASRRETNQKIHQFISRIEPGDVAMFYYAGHGVEINGQNYLLPVDVPAAEPGQEGFVKSESISLSSVLERLREKNALLNVVVLDACRNNPFKNESQRGVGSTRGLAVVTPSMGTFILYSADAGEAALDGLSDNDSNPNSVFTRVLAPMLLKPDIHLAMLARDVRRQVKALANTVQHQQTPAYYDAVLGDFYFSRSVAQQKPDTDAEVNAKVLSSPVSSPSRNDALELVFWEEVKDSKNVAFLQSYIRQYPKGTFVYLAKAKMEVLQRQSEPETKLAMAVPERVKPALVNEHKQCEAHLKANRLTTGKGGNAYDCYQNILDATPNDILAQAGIEQIEEKYLGWAKKYIAQGNKAKASDNIDKLRKVNADHPAIPGLLGMLEKTEVRHVASANEKPLSAHEKHNLQRGINLHEQYKWNAAFGLLKPLMKKNNLQATTRVANMLRRRVVQLENLDGMNYGDWKRLFKESVPRITGDITSDPWFMYFLGRAYGLGVGVSKDRTVEMKWVKKSANLGYARSQAGLGAKYLTGRGVEKNMGRALEWFHKAADQGYPFAYYKIAVMYSKGYGVTKDYYQAAMWHQKAADKGYPKSQNSIGWFYQTGKGLDQDYKKALYWYRKAAASGYALAMNNIGYLYRHGLGVTMDYKLAMDWFRQGAKGNSSYAQYNVGLMYRDAKGVKQDKKQAFHWFEKAAERGHKEAQYQLGLAYYRGSGVEKNLDKAMIWYQKAAAQGHSGAKASLKKARQTDNASLSDMWQALKKLK